jgi:type II secretory pathway component PulF
VLYVAGFVTYVLVRVMWSNETGRNVLLHVPVIGNAMRTAYAFRWITALRLEFGAGISLPNAVADAWRASGYLGAEKLALEGQHAMREGVALSTLVHRWRRLPRDWNDFIETGEISGALESSFKSLEAEASRAWTLAEERMASWLPKMAYFVIILVVAVQVGMLMYQVEVKPIIDAETQIDKATNGG